MLNRVLGRSAFSRAHKRSAAFVLALVSIASVSALAMPAFASPSSVADPIAITTKNVNGDGHIDHIQLTFNTAMDTAHVPTGYSVAGYTLAQPPAHWDSATQLSLILVPSSDPAGDTGVVPTVTYTSTPTNKSQTANGLFETENLSWGKSSTYTDGAGPALMQVLAKDFGSYGTFDTAGDEMDFIFSEPVSLAGTGAAAQLTSLQNSLKFSQIDSHATCTDGATHNPPESNFPKQDTQNDPTFADNPISVSGNTIKVVMQAGNKKSDIANVANPGFCGVGISTTSTTGSPTIQDLSQPANAAASQDQGGANRGRRDIQTLPTQVAVTADTPAVPAIWTQDLTPHVNGLGFIDAMKIQFEQPIDPASIAKTPTGKFSVSLGNSHATVTSLGAAAANAIYVRFTTPQPWAGDQTPAISFDGSGCTLHGEVPSPNHPYTESPWGGFTSCADSFSADPSKVGVGPAIRFGHTVDSHGSGHVDQVVLTLTKAITAGATVDGWTVNGSPISSIATDTPSKTATLTLTQANLGTDAKPVVAYSDATGHAVDAQGIAMNAQNIAASDGASPRLLTATTGSSHADGNTDSVTLQFSEPVDKSTLQASNFRVGADNATPGSISVNGATVTLSVNEPGTKSFPVNFMGSLQDLASPPNSNADGFALDAAHVHDGVAPVKVSVSTNPASVAKAQTVTVTAQFSEPLDATVAPVVKIGSNALSPLSDSAHTSKGYSTGDPTTWSGTYTFQSTDCADQNGCALGIDLAGFKDTAGNAAAEVLAGTITIDTVAPDAATSEASAAVQQAGSPSIAANSIGAHTSNLTVTANITADQVNTLGDATGGSATLLIDGNALNPTVSISGIQASATSISLQTAFQDAAALRNAISEGTHTFKIQLCDTAGNCSTSNGVTVTADYTPEAPTLTAPESGSFHGGDGVCITWTAPTTTESETTELRYSTDGGQSFPNLIATNPTQAACASGTGYQWTVPGVNTDQLRVEVRTIDGFANDASSASSSNMSVSTVTQTVLSLGANVGWIVNGAQDTLSGSLTGNGFAVAGKTVHIRSKPAGASSFGNVAAVTTGNDGTFRYTFKPASNAQYQAVFDANGPYLASSSSITKVTVAVSVPSSVNASSLKRGQTLTVKGNVWPGKASKPVYFQVYRGRGWSTLARRTLNPHSWFSFSYRSSSPVKQLFRVIYYGDSYNGGNAGRSYMITWR